MTFTIVTQQKTTSQYLVTLLAELSVFYSTIDVFSVTWHYVPTTKVGRY
jgi:hypothetical protein